MAAPHAQDARNPGAVQDLTGTTVGRFAIQVRLGAGGMGEVYRAEDTKLKRPVALKRMAPRLRADERYRRRFLQEAKRASRLNDQHIAGLYDVLEEEGEMFLVMEHVEGQTLRSRLGQPLHLGEFLPIGVQCGEALAAAHQKGIVHRDIKPENIMLTPAGQVKVLDFGVAQRLPQRDDEGTTRESAESTVGGFSGTVAYMAPEVLLEKEPDGRADIFSLGVVFYEAVTGRHPFRAETFVATADHILHEAPAPLRQLNPRIPAELERIVTKMLAKDPAERYATAADLVVDLRAAQRSLAFPRGERVPRAARRRKYARARLAIPIAVVVVVATLGLWRVFGPAPPPRQRIRVAAVPFANQTGDEALEGFRLTMTQMLVHHLTGSPNIQVLSYERLLDIIQGLEAQGKDISSPEAIQAIATFTNAQFVVVPKMFAVGGTALVAVEFRDAQTGETVNTTRTERPLSGSEEDTFYSMLGELAAGIQEYFKSVSGGEDYRAPPAGSQPKTATAALHFNEGRNTIARGEYARALDSLQRAVQEDSSFALAYAWMGHIYGLLGYDETARQLSEKAAGLISAETPLIDAYFMEANLAERKYDFSAAREKYLELIRLYADDPVWHVALAGVYEKQGQYQKAITNYQEALLLDPNYTVAHQKLGSLYSKTGDFPQARAELHKALNLYRALGNREGEAHALLDLGEIFRRQGDYPQATKQGELALRLSQGLGNDSGVIQATQLLGNIRFHRGDLEEARDYYQQVLSASGKIRNNRVMVATLMNMGVTYLKEGDLGKAVKYIERSTEQERIYGEYRDWPALRERAQTLTNLGGVLIEYGPDPERGLQYVQEALSVFQTMGDNRWVAQNGMLVGLYYANAGQYEQAINQLQASRSFFAAIEDKGGIAQSTYNMGRSYFFQNRYEQARELVESALGQFQALQDPFGVAMSRILLGWSYHRLGESAKAQLLLEQGLQTAQENGFGELLPDAYSALGELYRERGRAQQARYYFRQASDLGRGPTVSESSAEGRSHLGLLEAEAGNLERALSECRRAVAQARKLQHVHTLARTLINLAGVHLVRKDYPSAIEVLEETSSLGEGELGLELRAKAYFIEGKAYEAGGRTEESEAFYRQAQEAIHQLQQSLAPAHREAFASRPDIEALLR